MPAAAPPARVRETDLLRLATAGSVDDGKSTLIGRLLFDSKTLFVDQLAAVDEHDRDVRGRGAGDHVARVLHVAGTVGEDELAPGGLEVAVRNVERNALLALRAQAVGE